MADPRIVPEETPKAHTFTLRVPNAGILNRRNARVRVFDDNHLHITVRRKLSSNIGGTSRYVTSDYISPLNVPHAAIDRMSVRYSAGAVKVIFPKEPPA